MPMPVEIEMDHLGDGPEPDGWGGDADRHNLRYDADLAADQASVARNDRIFNAYPVNRNLLSQFTVFCLILNRTIGSGIFAQPYNVVSGAGSSGLALVIWVLAPLVCLCQAACWTEMALSIPRARDVDGSIVATPKSGGDKNYLEYIYKFPDLFITCVYGVTFILLGNLSGNAIQLGVLMETIRDPSCTNDPDCLDSKRGQVVGWALGSLLLVALFNITTRRGAILLNNVFATGKLALVVIMIFLGIIWGAVHKDGCRQISFLPPGPAPDLVQGSTQWFGGSLNEVIQAFTFAMFPSTGFEQPFYVLAEVKQPRRKFAPVVMFTMCLMLVLNPLINTSYFCVNPYLGSSSAGPIGYSTTNAAINYFSTISGGADTNTVIRGTSVLFVLSIFGNLLSVVFSSPRVKQEIAKEGILPKSLMFASSSDSLLSRLQSSSSYSPYPGGGDSHVQIAREQVPLAATLLHLSWEIILVLTVGLSMPPTEAYNTISYLYTYVITGILGFMVVAGLLYLRLDAFLHRYVLPRGPHGEVKGRHWDTKSEWSIPYVGALPALVSSVGLAIMLFGAFAKPAHEQTGAGAQTKWWVKPLVGWCALLLGVLWWLGIQLRQYLGQYTFQRRRTTYVEADEVGDLIQTAEMVTVWRDYK
ncbi:amino acid transporter [Rhypophila sp. PSN 637]